MSIVSSCDQGYLSRLTPLVEEDIEEEEEEAKSGLNIDLVLKENGDRGKDDEAYNDDDLVKVPLGFVLWSRRVE